MDVTEHIAALRAEGALVADTVERHSLDLPVPTCPGWQLRDLVRHLGGVHRWATSYVAAARTEHGDDDDEFMRLYPQDAGLLDWFRDGHASLVAALSAAPADLQCWHFLRAASPLAFWARRQAHETAVHRADVEGAGGPITPYEPHFAADGLDELFAGFFARRHGRLRFDPARTLAVRPTDVDDGWLLTMGPERLTTSRDPGAQGDCTVAGAASDLYRYFWNRRSADGLRIDGDDSLLTAWREQAKVRWS